MQRHKTNFYDDKFTRFSHISQFMNRIGRKEFDSAQKKKIFFIFLVPCHLDYRITLIYNRRHTQKRSNFAIVVMLRKHKDGNKRERKLKK